MIILLPLLGGFGSCSVSLTEVCGTRFPEFDRRTEDAVLALKTRYSSRRIASANDQLSDSERLRWQNWAEDLLKETQRYLDAAESDPRVAGFDERKRGALLADLHTVANSLVAFHGYAQQGRVDEMVNSLDRTRRLAQNTRQIACENPS